MTERRCSVRSVTASARGVIRGEPRVMRRPAMWGSAEAHLQRLRVAQQRVLIEEPRHDLVDVVIGHLHVAARLSPEVLQTVEVRCRRAAQVAGPKAREDLRVRRLALCESADELSGARAQLGVAGRVRHERRSRQVVAGEVAAVVAVGPVGGLPTAKGRRVVEREARRVSEVVRQRRNVEHQQVSQVCLLRPPLEARGRRGKRRFAQREGSRHECCRRRRGACGREHGCRGEQRGSTIRTRATKLLVRVADGRRQRCERNEDRAHHGLAGRSTARTLVEKGRLTESMSSFRSGERWLTVREGRA